MTTPQPQASPVHYHKVLKGSANLQDFLKTTVGNQEAVGVHSGKSVNLSIHPAEVGAGITFVRTDLGGKEVPARWDTVVDTRNATTIGNEEGLTVSMVEHVVAALAACGVDQARIELDGPEMPILDGGSDYYMALLYQAGMETVPTSRKVIHIRKEVRVTGDNDSFVSLIPSEDACFSVDFDFHGRCDMPSQSYIFHLNQEKFARDIAPARTFGFYEDAEKLRAMGLAQGASLDNTLVFHENDVMNKGGMRFKEECARHKILDAIGDLHLAGGLILGHYHGDRAGHALNNQLLRRLFEEPLAYAEE